MMAAARAFGAREPDESVRNPDWLAGRLLGLPDLELIRDHPIAAALHQDYELARRNSVVAGLANFALIRTRFIDERLERAVREGARQVVILGSGFDTRAYRLQELLQGRPAFEVDYHSTQELKKCRLAEALGGVLPNVIFVEIDFIRDALGAALGQAGYRRDLKTFFICEGVAMYLPEAAVRATLRAIAADSAAGSSVVLDFPCQAMIDALARVPDHPQHRFTTGWGEPWLFGVPDRREREFFRECGLELREAFSTVRGAALQRYLTRAEGGSLGRGSGGRHGEFTTLARIARNLRAAASLGTALRMLWMGATRRSKWYALAEAVVPGALAHGSSSSIRSISAGLT